MICFFPAQRIRKVDYKMSLSPAPPPSNRIRIKAYIKKPKCEIPEESEVNIEPITKDNMFEPLFMFTPRGTYVFTIVLHMFLLLGLFLLSLFCIKFFAMMTRYHILSLG